MDRHVVALMEIGMRQRSMGSLSPDLLPSTTTYPLVEKSKPFRPLFTEVDAMKISRVTTWLNVDNPVIRGLPQLRFQESGGRAVGRPLSRERSPGAQCTSPAYTQPQREQTFRYDLAKLSEAAT